jgi:hypothetical protein
MLAACTNTPTETRDGRIVVRVTNDASAVVITNTSATPILLGAMGGRAFVSSLRGHVCGITTIDPGMSTTVVVPRDESAMTVYYCELPLQLPMGSNVERVVTVQVSSGTH